MYSACIWNCYLIKVTVKWNGKGYILWLFINGDIQNFFNSAFDIFMNCMKCCCVCSLSKTRVIGILNILKIPKAQRKIMYFKACYRKLVGLTREKRKGNSTVRSSSAKWILKSSWKSFISQNKHYSHGKSAQTEGRPQS